MINICSTRLFSLLNKNVFSLSSLYLFLFFLQRGLFPFFPFPSRSGSQHLSQISCESISQQMKLFVYLFWSLKLTDEEKRKNFMYGEGHWGQWTFSLLLVHLWRFAQFIREEGKGHPLYMSGE